MSVRSQVGSASVEIHQLELVRFANQTGLKAQGEGVYLATESSGQPISIAHGTGRRQCSGPGLFGIVERENARRNGEPNDCATSLRGKCKSGTGCG